MTSTRPESVVRFECLALVTLIASIVGRSRQPVTIDLLSDLLFPALSLWLIVRIARRRSRGARAAYSAIWAFLLLLMAYAAATNRWQPTGAPETIALFVLLVAGQFVSLWARSSTGWLKGTPALTAAGAP